MPNNVSWLRNKAKLTQAEVGELVGASGQEISLIELENRTPSVVTFILLAYLFGVSVVELDGKLSPKTIERYEAEDYIINSRSFKKQYGRNASETATCRIVDIVTDKDITQTRLATLVGISRKMVYCYQKNIHRPSLEKAIRIAEVLEVTVEELYSF